MNYIQNLSRERAAAVATLLTLQGIPFTCRPLSEDSIARIDIAVDNAHSEALNRAIHTVHDAKTKQITLTTDVNSQEQASGYENGTLSNLAPGLAITVQIAPLCNTTPLTQHEAMRSVPTAFLALAAQGWQVDLILGDDIDIPRASA